MLDKLVFKLKHKLQGFEDNFCLLDCDPSFEKFQQTIIEEMKLYVPEKKSKVLSHKSWIDNSINNLAAKKNKNFINDASKKKQMVIKKI